MAVTYRAIERYSARRVSSTSLPSASGFDSSVRTLKQTHQILCRAASFYCSRLESILRPPDLSLVGALRLWLTHLMFASYVTLFLLPYRLLTSAAVWVVRWILTYYYSRNGVVCVSFDDVDVGSSVYCRQGKEKSKPSCWSLSVYLVDSGGISTAELRQSIADGAKDQPALRLVRKSEAFGWIHLWIEQHPNAESTLRMSSVQELPAVWKHQFVTEDSVHEYVSEVYCRQDGLKTDEQIPPWRIYLIPLDSSNNEKSNCCLLVHHHRLLRWSLDCVIRRVLAKHWTERVDYGRKSFDLPQRRHVPYVSWTRPIPSIDFIDRICLLTRSTCRQVVLAAFCQSINQCYRQSASSTVPPVLHVEMSSDYYTLPLGSSALEDGQVVLKTLKRQLVNPSFRIDPSLSVTMEIVISPGLGSLLHWTSSPTPTIPIRLCLWTNESAVRLGLIQHHQFAFPVRADDVERRIYQLAARLGVQHRRPLSPHSTSPSGSPSRLTPPPTPQLYR